jgi:AcrR family transcriptional regulator
MTDLAEITAIDERPTKGERTRARLLDLAVQRFGARGYRATSVSEIARSAGLTQAAVYAYFENKEALFRAAVDADADAMFDEVSAQVSGLDVRELIPSIIVHLVTCLPGHPLARRVVSGLEPEVVPRLVDLPALRRFSNLVRDELALAQRDGRIRPDCDPEVVAAGVESLVLGLLFTTVQSGGAATPRHIAGVVEAFDLMLRPSPPAPLAS